MKISFIYEFISVKNGYIEELFKSEKYLAYPLRFHTYPRLGTAALEALTGKPWSLILCAKFVAWLGNSYVV